MKTWEKLLRLTEVQNAENSFWDDKEEIWRKQENVWSSQTEEQVSSFNVERATWHRFRSQMDKNWTFCSVMFQLCPGCTPPLPISSRDRLQQPFHPWKVFSRFKWWMDVSALCRVRGWLSGLHVIWFDLKWVFLSNQIRKIHKTLQSSVIHSYNN